VILTVSFPHDCLVFFCLDLSKSKKKMKLENTKGNEKGSLLSRRHFCIAISLALCRGEQLVFSIMYVLLQKWTFVYYIIFLEFLKMSNNIL